MKLSERGSIIKNLFAINVAFLLIFAAVNSIISVQSVLHSDQRLGILNLKIAFIVELFTCLVIPQILAKLIGFKWSLVIAEAFYTLYIAANAFPRYYTLIPGALLNGMAQSVSWTILGIYLQILSRNYAKISGEKFLSVQNLFFGVSSALVMLANAFGSLLVALILKPEKELNGSLLAENGHVTNSTFDHTKFCGATQCHDDELPLSFTKPSLVSVYILCGVLIGVCVVATLITFIFVDNIEESNEEDDDDKKKEKVSLAIIGSMFRDEFRNLIQLFKCLDLYLLIPISVYPSFELTFMWTEFNKAFVACLASVNYIGWCTILFGVLGSLSSYFFGFITVYTTRVPILVLGICVSATIGVFMLSWTPNPERIFILFLLSGAYAVTQAITNTHVRGLYGIQFPKNHSAFSAVSLFVTIGFVAGFTCSAYLCISVKLYVYLAIVVASLLSYGALVVRNSYTSKQVSKKENHECKKQLNGKPPLPDNNFKDEHATLFVDENE